MPYRYLEEIATADVAFEAWGRSREELFTAAADALMQVMVDDLATVRSRQEVVVRLEHEAIDLLLFAFLQELIFHKDARRLLLRVAAIAIEQAGATLALHATFRGEEIDPSRHPLVVDVKAVTLHRFQVEHRDDTWRAQVVLDI